MTPGPAADPTYEPRPGLTCREADWGGLLHFLDPTGQRAVDTFTPVWNSLSLFRVPQMHEVSLVAPWAGSPRYSITGWFRRN